MRWAVLLMAMLGSMYGHAQELPDFQVSPRAESLETLGPLRNWLATHQQRAETVGTVIQTDRPSFTAAHTLVPKGWVQLESGYQFTHNRDGNLLTNTNGLPELNLRLGLAEWVEWRSLWSGVQTDAIHTRDSMFHDYRTSLANLQTGCKFLATNEDGWVPQSALITTVFIPTGSDDDRRAYPLVNYIYCWSLTEFWTLTGSTGAVLARHGDQGTNEWFQSIVLGQEWSEKLSTYGEWYVIRNDTAHGGSTPQTMDAGVLWRPLANIQFDWRAGFGLNSAADEFFTGVGFSARY